MSYYSHLAKGQASLLWSRETVDDLLNDSSTPVELRKRLKLSQKIRRFASEELKLPVGDAYTSYTDLKRPYAVWNIYAAPELSLESYTWCYPIVGCMAYRGYYNEERARKDAKALEEKGLETRVGGVRAYSTLGYFDDPLLSSFIYTDEPYLVELLIHEIAHRKLYIDNDTKFNENFATAVGQLGAEIWYRKLKQQERFVEYQQAKLVRQNLMDFVLAYKDKLQNLYQDEALDVASKRKGKQALLLGMRKSYQALKSEKGWDGRYDYWVNNLNNAGLSTLSNYQDLVPGFIALFHDSGGWESFYTQVEDLSQKSKAERYQRLKQLAGTKGE